MTSLSICKLEMSSTSFQRHTIHMTHSDVPLKLKNLSSLIDHLVQLKMTNLE